MNKQEFVEKLIKKTQNPKVDKTLNDIIETIEEVVAAGDCVKLMGFGTFEARNRAARISKDVYGKEYHVPARKSPVFRPGKFFKELVNNH